LYCVCCTVKDNEDKEVVQMKYREQKKNPVGTKFFAFVQTGPGARPAYYTMGTGCLFSGGKAAAEWL
jgi:hypothetical protein